MELPVWSRSKTFQVFTAYKDHQAFFIPYLQLLGLSSSPVIEKDQIFKQMYFTSWQSPINTVLFKK
jgi:hypothetical protein